jgi:hypothetical protein
VVGACSMHGEVLNAYKTFVGVPERNRPLGGPRRRWEVTLKWILVIRNLLMLSSYLILRLINPAVK